MKRLALLGVTLLITLLLGEGMVRIASVATPELKRLFREADPYAILVEPVGEIGYRARPHSTFRYGNLSVATSNAMSFRGPEVAPNKPAGTFRIILLGGSTTHGFGVADSATIDVHMRELLASRHPDRKFEVVNLGFDGYDSYQDVERFRSDGLPLNPDVVIANSGINDVRNAKLQDLKDPDPRTFLWAADLNRLREEQRVGRSFKTRVKHYVYLARLIVIVRENRHQGTEASRSRKAIAPPNLQAADLFERNMLRIDSLAAQRGIPLLLSTPPSSLRLKFKPTDTTTISYWLRDAETTQQFRDELDRRLREVAARRAREGRAIRYVPHRLGPELFLDDCHLNPAGNRQLATDFVDAIEPFLAPARSAR